MEPIVIFIAAIVFSIFVAFISETETGTEEKNDFVNDVFLKLTEEERNKFYRDFWKDKCNFKARKKSKNESLERDASAPE